MDFDYDFLKKVINGISAEEVSKKFNELMTDENRTIVVQGLEGSDITHLTKEEALDIINKVKEEKLTPYQDKELAKSLINEKLEGSPVIKTVDLPQFGAVEWTLKNNVKVVYKRTDYEKDNVLMAAYSFGGISKLPDNLVLPAYMLPAILPMYGLGDYDNVTLQKMLAGKKASVRVGLNETTETLSGSSTPKDFETMMQLLYLRFAHPRFDKVAHDAIIGRYTAYIGNMAKDPNKIKSDSISLITTGYNKRTPILTKESVSKITLDEIKKVYTDRFDAADEFTFFIVGNIGIDTARQMVEEYLGSLPSKGRKETWVDRKIKQPEGKIIKQISLPLTIPKATVFISFEEGMKYTPYNYLGLDVLKGILDLVYTDKVREQEGGTYGVAVSLNEEKRPEQMGEGMITFDCDPARAEELKAIIYKELNNIMKNGPTQEDLDKSVNNLLKTREEARTHNAYWLGTLTRFYSYGINSNDPANYEDILKSFTVKDIKKIADEMFKKANVVDLIFKPTK